MNRHLQVFEQAKLVTIVKTLEEGRPQTLCRMTTAGRKRYVDYLEVLEQVVLDAAAGLKDSSEIRLRGVTKA